MTFRNAAVAAAALVAASGLVSAASAAGIPLPYASNPALMRAATLDSQAAAATTAPATLVSTTISAGGENSALTVAAGSGLQPLDAAKTIVCPTGFTCRIEAEQHVSAGKNSVSGAEVNVASFVNGTQMTQPASPPTFEVPADNNYVSGGFAQNMSGLAAGTYTVQTMVQVLGGGAQATFASYEIDYRLYTQTKVAAAK